MKTIYECVNCEHRFYFEQTDELIDGVYPRCPKCGAYAESVNDPEEDLLDDNDDSNEDDEADESCSESDD